MARFTDKPSSARKAAPRYANFHNRTDAVRWAKLQEVDIERDDANLTTNAHRHTLAEVLARYRREVLPTKAPSTQPNYRIHLAWWESQLGTLRLADLRADRIDTCRDLLTESGKSPATVTRYLASLGAALAFAVKDQHWLTVSPLAQVTKPTVSNERTRFLTEAELTRLLTACRESTSPDLLLAVMLAISTGARQGEILNLRWRDLDLERGIITLRAGIETSTKGGSRGVALAGEVAPLLRDRAAAEVDPAALVFPSRVTRSHPIDLRKPFETALARAGITDFHWHDLRHSAASFLAVDGAWLARDCAILATTEAVQPPDRQHRTALPPPHPRHEPTPERQARRGASTVNKSWMELELPPKMDGSPMTPEEEVRFWRPPLVTRRGHSKVTPRPCACFHLNSKFSFKYRVSP